MRSRSPLGERGLKSVDRRVFHRQHPGRSPLGERGLKSRLQVIDGGNATSLSAWRAWIEICATALSEYLPNSRSPLGERGLKLSYRFYSDE